MSRFIWAWSADGSVIYVYEVYQPRFRRTHKLKQVKHFFTSDFQNVKDIAEGFIERLENISSVEGSNK